MQLSDDEKEKFLAYCNYVANINDIESSKIKLDYTLLNPVSQRELKKAKHNAIAASARMMINVLNTNPTLEVKR